MRVTGRPLMLALPTSAMRSGRRALPTAPVTGSDELVTGAVGKALRPDRIADVDRRRDGRRGARRPGGGGRVREAEELGDDLPGLELLQHLAAVRPALPQRLGRHRVGRQGRWAERAEAGAGADDVGDLQPRVLGEVADHGADEGVGPERVGQSQAEALLQDALQERLLAADAAQIAIGVPAPATVAKVGEVAAAG